MEWSGEKINGKSESIKRVRRHARDRERIFAQARSGKGLLPRIYKEFLKLNNKEMKKPNQKMAKRPEQTRYQRRCTDGK